MPDEKIGDRIKALRTAAGMKQIDLAKKLDISPSAIGMYEQNRRTPETETIARLAAIFNVTSDYLLGIQNKEKLIVPGLTPKQIAALHISEQLSDEQLKKVIEYAVLIMKAENQ